MRESFGLIIRPDCAMEMNFENKLVSVNAVLQHRTCNCARALMLPYVIYRAPWYVSSDRGPVHHVSLRERVGWQKLLLEIATS